MIHSLGDLLYFHFMVGCCFSLLVMRTRPAQRLVAAHFFTLMVACLILWPALVVLTLWYAAHDIYKRFQK